ncbi:DNA mismatch repair protein MsH2 [Entamoeba marina]
MNEPETNKEIIGEDDKKFMCLDDDAKKGLHIVNQKKELSLTTFLNKTKTNEGKKLLCEWILHPLLNVDEINQRLDMVTTFYDDSATRVQIRDEVLTKMPDVSKLLKNLNKVNIEQIVDLYDFVKCIHELDFLISPMQNSETMQNIIVKPLKECLQDLENFEELVVTLIDMEAVAERQYKIRDDFDDGLKKKQAAIDLNIQVAKIKIVEMQNHGQVLRVAKSNEKDVKSTKKYIILQSLKGECKFTVKEMQTLNTKKAKFQKQVEELSKEFVNEIVKVVCGYESIFLKAQQLISVLDVIQSFASISTSSIRSYTRPLIHNSDNGIIKMVDARHPLSEIMDGIDFIENNVFIDRKTSRFQIVTGPNMGGKSTFLRMIGLNVVLSQIGMYVPCSNAEISICDGILCRIGADDDIVAGVSTFMAEMIDSSKIVKQASINTLVLIDELGRGTSTFDGFGIAWAISEHLSIEIGCYCIFATHFHEITALEKRVGGVKNLHVVADIVDKQLVLQYQVKDGSTDQSLAVYVAEWADFPEEVVDEAKRKASELDLDVPDAKKKIETFSSNMPGIDTFDIGFGQKEIEGGKEIMKNFENEVINSSNEISDSLIEKYQSLANDHPYLKIFKTFV